MCIMEIEELYKKHHKQILLVARKYKTEYTPEDLAQKFWYYVCKLNNEFENDAHFMTYARKALKNIYLTIQRKGKYMESFDDVDLCFKDIEFSSLIERVISGLSDDEKTYVYEFIDGEYTSNIAIKHNISRSNLARLIKNVQKRYIEEKNKCGSVFKICEYNRN